MKDSVISICTWVLCMCILIIFSLRLNRIEANQELILEHMVKIKETQIHILEELTNKNK